MKRRISVFYGWWVVMANLSILSVVFGTGFYSFGIFFKPLANEFNWGRAEVAGAMSLFSLFWALSAPVGGRFSDRFGPRKVMLFSAIPFGASFLLLAVLQNLWQLYLLYSILALTYSGLSLVQASSLVTRWFRGEMGVAMGITFAGVSLGGMVFAPIVGYLINILGWRHTYFVLGIGSWVIMLPLILWVVKDRPGSSPAPIQATSESAFRAKLAKGGTVAAAQGVAPSPPPAKFWTTYQMVRSPAFWGISIAFFLSNMGQIGVLTHQVAYMTDRDISPLMAAWALGFTSGIGVLGKVLTGYAADRWSKILIAAASFILGALGLLILMQDQSLLGVWAFVIIFGLSIAGAATIRPLMVVECFGEASFGAIYGWIELTRLLGATLGPLFAGWIYDVTKSYDWAFITFISLFLVGIAPLVLVKPPNKTKS